MDLRGSVLRDVHRVDVGHVRGILLDPDSLDARWLEVSLPAGTTAVVPAVATSQFAAGELLVPWSADHIAAAVHERGASITVDEARRLRTHYGFADG